MWIDAVHEAKKKKFKSSCLLKVSVFLDMHKIIFSFPFFIDIFCMGSCS